MSEKKQDSTKKNVEKTLVIKDDVSEKGGKPDGVPKTSEEESEDDIK